MMILRIWRPRYALLRHLIETTTCLSFQDDYPCMLRIFTDGFLLLSVFLLFPFRNVDCTCSGNILDEVEHAATRRAAELVNT